MASSILMRGIIARNSTTASIATLKSPSPIIASMFTLSVYFQKSLYNSRLLASTGDYTSVTSSYWRERMGIDVGTQRQFEWMILGSFFKRDGWWWILEHSHKKWIHKQWYCGQTHCERGGGKPNLPLTLRLRRIQGYWSRKKLYFMNLGCDFPMSM